jgi:soluble lytic murein transglycosylase-like protein
MMSPRHMITIGLLAWAMLFFSTGSLADIYRYKDERGVWHFTNIKTDKRYRFYMRETRSPLSGSEYIKKYEYIINQASKRFGVEPSLIKAVIKAESDFDHKAQSNKGAQGLMQLMPGTSNDMAVQDPFNPEENIFGGTRYLSLMLERFKNDKRLALAAYNAGPDCVDGHGGMPPFRETKSFVEKVLRYYEQYSSGKRQPLSKSNSR